MARERRTKAELEACGYYEWVKECKRLREQKRKGLINFTQDDKEFLRRSPTPKRPYRPTDVPEATEVPRIKSVNINWGTEKEFKTGGNSFFCEVRNLPFTDEECMLFCEIKQCPFNGKGYFRTKGKKF